MQNNRFGSVRSGLSVCIANKTVSEGDLATCDTSWGLAVRRLSSEFCGTGHPGNAASLVGDTRAARP